jgi:uncharacterized protein
MEIRHKKTFLFGKNGLSYNWMAINSKEELIDFLTLNRTQLKEWGVIRLGLFGSFVRREQSEQSDIDLLVEFEKSKKTFDNFMDLAWFLEDNTQRKIDLLTPESLSPHIGPKILKDVEYYAL